MISRLWIQKIFGIGVLSSVRASRKTDRRARLKLEALEDRLAPASFLVTDASDNPADANSLRYAVNHLASGANAITFAPGLAGQTISLTAANGGELLITQNVTITGLGADQLAVSGSNTSRVFDVHSGVTVAVTGLTIENGLTTNTLGGGAILNAGALTLTADAVVNSTAQGGNASSGFEGGGGGGAGLGGGIFNSGTLNLASSTLSGDQAVGGNGGTGETNISTGSGGPGSGPNGGAGAVHPSGAPGGAGGYASGGGGGSYQPGTVGGGGGFGGGGGGGGDPGALQAASAASAVAPAGPGTKRGLPAAAAAAAAAASAAPCSTPRAEP